MENTKNRDANTGGRMWYLDFLRIFATFTVVVLHLAPLVHPQVAVGSAQWNAANIISNLVRWNVPVFFMISGALFLSGRKNVSTPRLYKKTIARMLTSYGIWSAFYALWYCLMTGKGKWTFLNQLLRGHYHMWYILAIVSLYWITPLLRKITESKKATEYFLLTGFVFSFVCSRLLGFALLLDPPHSDVVASLQSMYAQMNPYRGLCYLYYYVLGHYLHEYPVGKGMRRAIFASGIAGFAAVVILTDWHSRAQQAVNSFFFELSSIGVMAMAAAVFVLFQGAFAHVRVEGRIRRAVLHASGCSFGVYLFHAFAIERIDQYVSMTPTMQLLCLPLTAAGVYALSYLVAAALRRIPVLRDYIV